MPPRYLSCCHQCIAAVSESRWIQAGSFYTFTRNHNSINSNSQELYLWPTVAEAGRKALAMRYSLLPYLYTEFFKVNRAPGTYKGQSQAASMLLGSI